MKVLREQAEMTHQVKIAAVASRADAHYSEGHLRL